MRWFFGSGFGILGSILVVLAIPLLAIAGAFYFFFDYSTRDWVPATGTVVEVYMGTDAEGNASGTYCPEIEFTSAAGEDVKANPTECSSPAAYASGDVVELKYNPANPRDLQIKGGATQSMARTFEYGAGGIGALLVGGGLAALLVGAVVVARRA